MPSSHAGSRVAGGTPQRSESAVRRCAEETCTTRLSRYNSSDRCYAHTPPHFPRIRGKVVSPAG